MFYSEFDVIGHLEKNNTCSPRARKQIKMTITGHLQNHFHNIRKEIELQLTS